MTAREFLEMAGYVVNEFSLFALTQYVDGDIDYSKFPDAEVVTQEGTPLSECAEEPVLFQEYLEKRWVTLWSLYLYPEG